MNIFSIYLFVININMYISLILFNKDNFKYLLKKSFTYN